ncbi:MAG: DUF2785 domain-containing protein [Vicinamibacteraceae bacterium]|nr:DUF2785 domain-containing protein [Vicinamibacteraceae bacterium]
MSNRRPLLRLAAVVLLVSAATATAQVQAPARVQAPASDRDRWIAFAKGGFIVPEGRTAIDLLVEMTPLLASTDPVLRDEVTFGAIERWILRERRVTPADLRRLLALWSANLAHGLGERGDDRVFGRSFSALALSAVAAADLGEPFLEPAELQVFFDRMLDYFARERDLRGFDAERGWMHTVAHTADVLKYLVHNPRLGAGGDVRLLAAVREKIEGHDAVFTWGENDRIARALHAAVRRGDADRAALESWTAHWLAANEGLWAGGPQVEPARFARVENAKQVMRSLFVALTLDAEPTPAGQDAAKVVRAALVTLR